MKAVAYVRVSREDEDPENQVYVIRQYCEEKGLDCIFFPPEVEVARTTHPLERDIFKQVVAFMETNNIPILIVESIDRLLADPNHWQEVYKHFAERGWRIIFVRDADLTEALETVTERLEEVKKRADSEVVRQVLEMEEESLRRYIQLYWRIKVAVAKDYVDDVRRKVKRAMDRLKQEGRVYTKPDIIVWYALFLSGKNSFRELTREDIERARNELYRRYAVRYLDGHPVRRLHKTFLETERPFIEWLRQRLSDRPRSNTYLSYTAFHRMIKKLIST